MLTLTEQLAELRIQIDALVRASGSTLPEVYGVGPVVAATIIGHVSDVRRYPTRHHFATANGTAPIPASSGRTVRHRLNRGGNRQLNRALYTIAITQIRRRHRRPRLLPAQTSRRQNQPRSPPLPQKTAV